MRSTIVMRLVVVGHADVAGAQPAVPDHPGGGGRVVEVAQEQRRTPHPQLAPVAELGLDIAQVGAQVGVEARLDDVEVDQAEPDAVERSPDGGRCGIGEVVQQDRPRRLGEPVAACHPHSEPLPKGVGHGRRQVGGARDGPHHPGQLVTTGIRRRPRGPHLGHGRDHVDALAGDQVERGRRAEAVDEHHAAAGPQHGGHRAVQPEHVGDGQRPQRDGGRSEPAAGLADLRALHRSEVAVAQGHRVRSPGRAAGEQHRRRVLVGRLPGRRRGVQLGGVEAPSARLVHRRAARPPRRPAGRPPSPPSATVSAPVTWSREASSARGDLGFSITAVAPAACTPR